MAAPERSDFEQHYLALFNWLDQGTLRHLKACQDFVARRVPCKIHDGPGSQDKASTILLGHSWSHWNRERHDRTLKLLRLYERAGYVDGARLLGPVGDKDGQFEFMRPTRRLPLASAMHFRNTAATVLLLDRGLLCITDVRPAFESFVRECRPHMLHLLTPELKSEEAFSHFAAIQWEDDPAGLAQVTEALMRHHLREQGTAPAMKDDSLARRALRASI